MIGFLKWIAFILGVLLVIGAVAISWLSHGLSCGHGTPGRCRSLWQTWFEFEAIGAFWAPVALGAWMLAMGAMAGTGKLTGHRRLAMWVMPVLIVGVAVLVSLPRGMLSGEPESLSLGLEAYHDRPVAVTALTINGADRLRRLRLIGGQADIEGLRRQSLSDTHSQPWAVGWSKMAMVEAEWSDLRTGQAWRAALEIDTRDLARRESNANKVILTVVFGPSGLMQVASDTYNDAATRPEDAAILRDLGWVCGDRVPERDEDWTGKFEGDSLRTTLERLLQTAGAPRGPLRAVLPPPCPAPER